MSSKRTRRSTSADVSDTRDVARREPEQARSWPRSPFAGFTRSALRKLAESILSANEYATQTVRRVSLCSGKRSCRLAVFAARHAARPMPTACPRRGLTRG
jgi:hypothetical protein